VTDADSINLQGMIDEYTSAVLCRVALGRAALQAQRRGDTAGRDAIHGALAEARAAEEQCRLAVQHSIGKIVADLEAA
jgi:hypothetical protein